jgi:hypothetical protein
LFSCSISIFVIPLTLCHWYKPKGMLLCNKPKEEAFSKKGNFL